MSQILNDCNCCGFGFETVFIPPQDVMTATDFTGTARDSNRVYSKYPDTFGNLTSVDHPNTPPIYVCGVDKYYAINNGVTSSAVAPFPPDSATYPIVRYNQDMTVDLAITFQGSMTVAPVAIDVDGNGNIYAIDAAGILYKFDSTGTVEWETEIALEGGDPDVTQGFSAIAVDLDGNIGVVGADYQNLHLEDLRWHAGLFDSDGNLVWRKFGEFDKVGLDQERNHPENVQATSCCFDSNGNLYVGFGPNEDTWKPTATTDFVWARCFSSSDGTVLWEKFKTYNISNTNKQFAAAIALSPGGERLAILRYHRDQFLNNPAIHTSVEMYSGTDFNTIDWTRSQGTLSGGSSSVGDRNLADGCFDSRGYFFHLFGVASAGNFEIVNPNGTRLSGASHSPYKNVCALPGKHPWFI